MQYQEILDAVAGSEKEFSLEHRIFNCAIAASIASLIPGFLFMLTQGMWSINLVLLVANILYLYIYRLCRFTNQLQKAVLVFTCVGGSLLNIMWIADRGVHGSTGYFIFVVILVIAFTAEKPLNYLAVIFSNLFLLFMLDTTIQAEINWKVPSSTMGQKASLFAAVLYLAILAMFYKQIIHRKLDQTYIDVMKQLGFESANVNKTADALAVTSEQLLAFTLQQKSATEQLSVTTEELGATAEQNNQLASSAMTTLKTTENNISISKDTINLLVQSIDEIKKSSLEIQTINNVINDIAFQTNILSLNAMIEASRAGGSNSGFKVVALEVKRLAERSAKAVESIDKLLNNNFTTVQGSVGLAADMNLRFKEISESMHPLVNTIQNVADASAEQHEAIRQITRGIEEIDQAVDENKNLASMSSSTANELRKNAASLLVVVDFLQLQVAET